MRNKYLSKEEFENLFYSGEKLIFDLVFPFDDLTVPPETLCVAWHWSYPQIRGSTGTAYAFRVGLDGAPFKADVYSLRVNGEELPILHVSPKAIGYHHMQSFEEIPSFVVEQAPTEVLDKFKNAF